MEEVELFHSWIVKLGSHEKKGRSRTYEVWDSAHLEELGLPIKWHTKMTDEYLFDCLVIETDLAEIIINLWEKDLFTPNDNFGQWKFIAKLINGNDAHIKYTELNDRCKTNLKEEDIPRGKTYPLMLIFSDEKNFIQSHIRIRVA